MLINCYYYLLYKNFNYQILNNLIKRNISFINNIKYLEHASYNYQLGPINILV